MEKIWNHLTNELKKYCSENGFEGITLGLSGGIDSALVTAIGIDALGAENVHCYMMSTTNTSQLSKDLAHDMCLLNNLKYNEINISNLFNEYKKTIPSPNNQTTYENLQARIRGNIIMAFSNDNPWLTLACGNKSELSMGYCTLYGDMCGGLAPIAELYKTEVYQLAAWRNEQGLIIPEGIITRAPTAELAPNQKDQDSLPPYDILDNILLQLVEAKKEEITGADKLTIDWVKKQYHKMDFKRNQAAPAIKVRHLL